MSTPFMGQIEIFSFNFAPKGWAQCNGQTLPINQNQALFALLGTTFGGNGSTTFQLPDLQSRVPIHQSSGFIIGQRAGEEAHTLIMSEMPSHNHPILANSLAGTTETPATNTVLANTSGAGVANPGGPYNLAILSTQAPNNVQWAGTLGNSGGNQAHNNLMPYLTLNMCIALQGIFPSRN